MQWQEINAVVLAYLGDAVYELWVRTHLLEQGPIKVKELHKTAVRYVCAGTQAQLLHMLLPDLEKVELQVVSRGRNAKGNHPKNTDVVTYRYATALEALVGYWYLEKRQDRMDWAFSRLGGIVEKSETNSSLLPIHEQ